MDKFLKLMVFLLPSQLVLLGLCPPTQWGNYFPSDLGRETHWWQGIGWFVKSSCVSDAISRNLIRPLWMDDVEFPCAIQRNKKQTTSQKNPHKWFPYGTSMMPEKRVEKIPHGSPWRRPFTDWRRTTSTRAKSPAALNFLCRLPSRSTIWGTLWGQSLEGLGSETFSFVAYEGTHLDQMIHLAECHEGKKVVNDQNSVPIGFASHQKNPICKAFLSVFLCLLLLFSHSAEESLLGFVHQHELGETALNLREGGSFGYSSYHTQSPTPKHNQVSRN